jgi:hypothetical protein
MDVYLIPTATAGRYELYYEAPDDPPTETGESGGGLLDRLTFGWFSRVQHRFDDMLLEAEEWRHRRHEAQPEPAGVLAKARRKVMGYIVERIAEQRLLWHLRKQERVCARIPSDISESEADAVIRGMVKKDVDHHLKWLGVDFLLLALSFPLMVIPGPNVPGFYFFFQVVSHYLSWRGAKRGLELAPWEFKTCDELTELRAAMTLTPPQRQRRFHELADRLRLEHLPTFLDDVAARAA